MEECTICNEQLRGVKGHIIQQAKAELWAKEFFNRTGTPHLDFVKKNYKPKKKLSFNY